MGNFLTPIIVDLKLDGNFIEEIPGSIIFAEKLKTFSINRNKLRKIDPNILSVHIQKLSIRENDGLSAI